MVLGSIHDGQLAGVIGLAFQRPERVRHKATVFGLYVPAGFRRQGIGRGLLIAALAATRDRHYVKVAQLTVTSGNTNAEALYASCGFESFGVEPLAVATDSGFVSKIHMWRDLR